MSDYTIKTVTISTDLYFQVLESLAFSAMYLNLPEDWKPYKFDSPEEYAEELKRTYGNFVRAGEKAFGSDPDNDV